MIVRKFVAAAIAILLTAPMLTAFQPTSADVTGIWTGTFRIDGGEPRSAYLALKQKGGDLTGTAGPDADQQMPIFRGKVATVNGVTRLTFEAPQGDGPALEFDLQLVEGRLKGRARAEANGQKREATVDVGRAKSLGLPARLCPAPSMLVASS